MYSDNCNKSYCMIEQKPFRSILFFSLPLVFANLFQQLYSFTDAWIVSEFVSGYALGSVGSTSSIQFLVIGFCIGFSTGLAIPVSHAFGAKDEAKLYRIIRNSMLVSLVLSVALAVLFCSLIHPIISILQIQESLSKDAISYLIIIFAGIPATVFYNLAASVLRAVGNSRSPSLYLFFSLFINLILDLLFVIVFGLGVIGAATATVLAQALCTIICFLKINKQIVKINEIEFWRKDPSDSIVIKDLISVGIPMGLQSSITALGAIIIQRANNELGDIYSIAFAAGSKIRQVFMCPFDAFATGTSVYLAQNIGNRKYERINKGVLAGVFIGVSYGLIAGSVIFVFCSGLTSILLDSDLLSWGYCVHYLKCIGISLWLLGILNVCRMSLQGMKYAKTAMISGVIELLSRIILTCFFIPVYGYTAVCFNEPFAWVCSSIFVLIACNVTIRKIRGKANG